MLRLHAPEMAAKLQEMGYKAYFYEPAAGGHGYCKDNKERASFTALGYNFLRRAIGAAQSGGNERARAAQLHLSRCADRVQRVRRSVACL
jgi:hypothetical protein